MTLERELSDLKNRLLIVRPEDSPVDLLMELVWELTDLEEIELPPRWDVYDEDVQLEFLEALIKDNLRQSFIKGYIEEQNRIRVKRRHKLEAKGEHVGTIG